MVGGVRLSCARSGWGRRRLQFVTGVNENLNLKFEITRCDEFVIFVTADRSEIEWYTHNQIVW